MKDIILIGHGTFIRVNNKYKGLIEDISNRDDIPLVEFLEDNCVEFDYIAVQKYWNVEELKSLLEGNFVVEGYNKTIYTANEFIGYCRTEYN